MLGSSLAYSFLQAMRPTEQEIEIPEKNIIDYALTVEQENRLLREGKTIIKFYHSLACLDCLDYKNLVEQLANDFSDQIFLEEIITKNSVENLPKITFMSYYKQEDLFRPTQEQLIDVLCDVMIKPPIACIRREV